MRILELEDAQVAYLEDGPGSGPLALCLHGFPDTAHTWRFLMPVLAQAGWHVVCPNLRGFAPTRAPADGPAGAATLGADANAIHELLRADSRAILIGHDWGAAAAFAASSDQPNRWSNVVACGWPPGTSNVDCISYEQMRRSWYVFLFQTAVAEEIVRADDFVFIERLWKDWCSPEYDACEDVREAKAALKEPDCIRLVLSHYRTLFEPNAHAGSFPPMRTLYVHGEVDGCIGAEAVRILGVEKFLADGSAVEIIPGAGHFPHLERSEAFNAEVMKFLRQTI